mgnify:CR=1 FL=1
MASEGYAVLVVEHADGSASMCRTHDGSWKGYSGLGDKRAQVSKLNHRVQEVEAAYALLQRLQAGGAVQQQQGEEEKEREQAFAGLLDLDSVSLAGHSYGGVTAAAAAATLPWVKAVVTLCPWW